MRRAIHFSRFTSRTVLKFSPHLIGSEKGCFSNDFRKIFIFIHITKGSNVKQRFETLALCTFPATRSHHLTARGREYPSHLYRVRCKPFVNTNSEIFFQSAISCIPQFHSCLMFIAVVPQRECPPHLYRGRSSHFYNPHFKKYFSLCLLYTVVLFLLCITFQLGS